MVPISYNIRNLIQRKGTTLMTAVGIALTVAVLVTALALSEGLKSVFSRSGHPLQMIVLRKGTSAELTSEVSNEAYQIVRQMPGIDKTSTPDHEPFVSQEGLTTINLPSVDSPEGMNVSLRGLLPIGLDMRTYNIEQGVMFKPGLRQVVVGKSIALRYPSARIGQKLKFGRGLWEVVGVFSSGDSAANSEMWVDLNQFRGDFDRPDSCSLLVRADSNASLTNITKVLEDDQRLGVHAMNEKEYYASMTDSGQPLEYLGFSVAVIMAVGSAFAATNTMYAAVARRTREIGTLRALGFSRWSVLMSFMLESIFLALLGGAVGVMLAFPINGMTSGVGNFSKTFSEVAFKFQIGPMSILAALIFATVIGAVGGFLPAWAAARKDIIQAMREG